MRRVVRTYGRKRKSSLSSRPNGPTAIPHSRPRRSNVSAVPFEEQSTEALMKALSDIASGPNNSHRRAEEDDDVMTAHCDFNTTQSALELVESGDTQAKMENLQYIMEGFRSKRLTVLIASTVQLVEACADRSNKYVLQKRSLISQVQERFSQLIDHPDRNSTLLLGAAALALCFFRSTLCHAFFTTDILDSMFLLLDEHAEEATIDRKYSRHHRRLLRFALREIPPSHTWCIQEHDNESSDSEMSSDDDESSDCKVNGTATCSGITLVTLDLVMNEIDENGVRIPWVQRSFVVASRINHVSGKQCVLSSHAFSSLLREAVRLRACIAQKPAATSSNASPSQQSLLSGLRALSYLLEQSTSVSTEDSCAAAAIAAATAAAARASELGTITKNSHGAPPAQSSTKRRALSTSCHVLLFDVGEAQVRPTLAWVLSGFQLTQAIMYCKPSRASGRQDANDSVRNGDKVSWLSSQQLAGDVFLSCCRMMMNLTNKNPTHCRTLLELDGLAAIVAFLKKHVPGPSDLAENIDALQKNSLKFDSLLVTIGVLTNCLEVSSFWRIRFQAHIPAFVHLTVDFLKACGLWSSAAVHPGLGGMSIIDQDDPEETPEQCAESGTPVALASVTRTANVDPDNRLASLTEESTDSDVFPEHLILSAYLSLSLGCAIVDSRSNEASLFNELGSSRSPVPFMRVMQGFLALKAKLGILSAGMLHDVRRVLLVFRTAVRNDAKISSAEICAADRAAEIHDTIEARVATVSSVARRSRSASAHAPWPPSANKQCSISESHQTGTRRRRTRAKVLSCEQSRSRSPRHSTKTVRKAKSRLKSSPASKVKPGSRRLGDKDDGVSRLVGKSWSITSVGEPSIACSAETLSPLTKSPATPPRVQLDYRDKGLEAEKTQLRTRAKPLLQQSSYSGQQPQVSNFDDEHCLHAESPNSISDSSEPSDKDMEDAVAAFFEQRQQTAEKGKSVTKKSRAIAKRTRRKKVASRTVNDSPIDLFVVRRPEDSNVKTGRSGPKSQLLNRKTSAKLSASFNRKTKLFGGTSPSWLSSIPRARVASRGMFSSAAKPSRPTRKYGKKKSSSAKRGTAWWSDDDDDDDMKVA